MTKEVNELKSESVVSSERIQSQDNHLLKVEESLHKFIQDRSDGDNKEKIDRLLAKVKE